MDIYGPPPIAWRYKSKAFFFAEPLDGPSRSFDCIGISDARFAIGFRPLTGTRHLLAIIEAGP